MRYQEGQSQKLTLSSCFEDDDLELEFRRASWPEDRSAFLTVALVVSAVFVAFLVFDFHAFGGNPVELALALSIRFVVVVATLALFFDVYTSRDFTPFEHKAFFQELLIISSYLIIASLTPEYIELQIAAATVILTFVWFFVPIKPGFSLISSALLLCGAYALQYRFSDNDLGGYVLSSAFYFSLILMGVQVTRTRNSLRRQSFLNRRARETAFAELETEVATRRAAEEDALLAKKRFEDLFRTAPMPLVLMTADGGTIMSTNDAFADLVGQASDKIVGRNAADFAVPDDNVEKLRSKSFQTREVIDGAINVRTAAGKIRECTITAISVKLDGSGGKAILAAIHDITNRKRFERQLVIAQQDAESGLKAQENFLATMSHEIRTPLNGVLGMLQLVEMEDINKTARANIAIARQSGEHLLQLISDVLELSKLKSGKLSASVSEINCRDLCEKTVEVIRATLKSAPVEVSADIEIPTDVYRIDELHTRQILYNLLGNAAKFTREGEIALVVREIQAEQNTSGRLRFEVRDTGIGIDLANSEGLFEEFSQGDVGSTRRYGGTGLGLPISKKLVEMMGGNIGVAANQPHGSVFWFEIPAIRCRGETTAPPQQNGLPSKSAEKAAKPQVLVAEDNPVNQRLQVAFLQKLGLDCTTVANGREALEQLRERDFALVLMDIQMPEMDGLTAIKHVRGGATPRDDVPIIVVTANAMVGDRESYIAAGADGYLAKPISLESLRDAINTFVDTGSAAEPNKQSYEQTTSKAG